jgi:protein-disulfide isomerase
MTKNQKGTTMNRSILRRSVLALAAVGLLAGGLPARADMTQQQVQELLNELKLIRQALERGGAPGGGAPAAPPDDKVSIPFTPGPYSVGAEKAPLVIVEYTDYQCPFCQQFHNTTFPQIKANYIDTGKVRYVNRDFPLDFHADARGAATAARCAAEQGKFWDLRHAMIVNADKLKPDNLMTYADNVRLDKAKFKTCLDSDKYRAEIDKHIQEGNAAGVNGTPSFVIGYLDGDKLSGVRMVGAMPYAQFDAKIQEMLDKAGKK